VSDIDSSRDIPQISIPKEAMSELSKWIEDEINRALAERSDLEAKIAEWYKLYEAIPKVSRKTFPWDGASNLVVPTTAIHVESIVARFMNAIFGAGDPWKAIPKSSAWADVANPIERWINWVGRDVLNLYNVMESFLLASAKVGTGILKLTWEVHKRKVVMANRAGGTDVQEITVHDGPMLRNVPLIDFVFSSDALAPMDIQTCEWVAHRTVKTRKQLMELQSSGVYTNVEKILPNFRSTITDAELQINDQVGINPTEYRDYEIWEVWCSYDVDGTGIPAELVVDIHLDTKAVLRAIYNPYRHQERPFHIVRHMPRDNHLLGIGLAQMLQDVQEETTTIRNQRVDNATLANMKIYKRKIGCKVSHKDIYPGAVISVNDPDDLTNMDMGMEHASLLSEELHANSIGEKRSGVSDYTVGRESAAIGSRATATSTLALIGEGNKRFQFTIKDIKHVMANIPHQIIGLYQQFAPDSRVFYEMFSEKEKALVGKYFQLPPEISRDNIVLDILAIDEVNNKAMQQQISVALMEMLEKYYTGIIQALSLTVNPNVPDSARKVAMDGALAATKLWERILESFDIVDTKAYVPDLMEVFGEGKQGNPGGGQAGGILGNTSEQVPGMEGNISNGAVPGAGLTENIQAPGENRGTQYGGGSPI
jgi:hypothetical protein